MKVSFRAGPARAYMAGVSLCVLLFSSLCPVLISSLYICVSSCISLFSSHYSFLLLLSLSVPLCRYRDCIDITFRSPEGHVVFHSLLVSVGLGLGAMGLAASSDDKVRPSIHRTDNIDSIRRVEYIISHRSDVSFRADQIETYRAYNIEHIGQIRYIRSDISDRLGRTDQIGRIGQIR